MTVTEPTYPVACSIVKAADLGTIKDHAIFAGYALKGYLLRPVTVGEHIVVLRTERNSIVVPGIFETSTVRSIVRDDAKPFEIAARTANSTYIITLHPEVPLDAEVASLLS